MHAALRTLRSANYGAAEVHVWTFKKSVREQTPVYTGRWLATTEVLDGALREAVANESKRLTETLEYSILQQNNEASAMTIGADETHAPFIVDQIAEPTPKRKVTKLKDVANASFYAVKFQIGSQAIYGVRKTDDSWRTRKAAGIISVVFEDALLELDSRPRFGLSKEFDFFIVDDTILVVNKGRFESLLNFKAGHIEDFEKLQSDSAFSSLFSVVEPLHEYVGSNKIQLRRASAIRQKANYRNADFMKRLREECKALGFNITFDSEGRIVPTAETCADIFKALLDHRLESRLSQRLYDVENTSAVTI